MILICDSKLCPSKEFTPCYLLGFHTEAKITTYLLIQFRTENCGLCALLKKLEAQCEFRSSEIGRKVTSLIKRLQTFGEH